MQLVGGFKTPTQQESGAGLDATANPYAIGKVEEVKDQYMLGDSLLVAPIPPGVKTRKVVLPAGRWYDFYTGRLAGDGQTVEVTPPLSQIPLFVRDGGLVPLIPERQWAPGPAEVVPLEVRHYGELPGALALYDDDGETFDYERGDYSWTRLSVTRDARGEWQGKVTPDRGGKRWHYSDVSWTFMTK
jgi:alpha-D-xyloside xylohydrolase